MPLAQWEGRPRINIFNIHPQPGIEYPEVPKNGIPVGVVYPLSH